MAPDNGMVALHGNIGRLLKDGGPAASFEIGIFGSTPSAIDDAQRDASVLWTKQGKVGGRTIEMAMRRGGRLTVSNGLVAVTASHVWTHEDVVDVMMMVLTWDHDAWWQETMQEIEKQLETKLEPDDEKMLRMDLQELKLLDAKRKSEKQ